MDYLHSCNRLQLWLFSHTYTWNGKLCTQTRTRNRNRIRTRIQTKACVRCLYSFSIVFTRHTEKLLQATNQPHQIHIKIHWNFFTCLLKKVLPSGKVVYQSQTVFSISNVRLNLKKTFTFFRNKNWISSSFVNALFIYGNCCYFRQLLNNLLLELGKLISFCDHTILEEKNRKFLWVISVHVHEFMQLWWSLGKVSNKKNCRNNFDLDFFERSRVND